jgi:hypothetical protein
MLYGLPVLFCRSSCYNSRTQPVTEKTHIEVTPGICGGRPRIAGHRIRVQDVVIWIEQGQSEDQIDEDQLAYARANGRVLVTRDCHFLVLHSRQAEHGGIAYWHPRRRNVGQIVLDLTLLWRAATGGEMRGRVEYL